MNYIYRTISESIKNDLQYYQAIVITGPRQVGKTTLCKKLFPDYDYVNLENIPTREIIREDIQKFIDNINKGIIID
ncbi:MAG: AAA family ATPase, partial [Bacteroidales bacterium]|nr:AAA family ATPase [Bacteroidales bacterium]